MYKIGVVGYSSGDFDKEVARAHIRRFLNLIGKYYANTDDIAVVSGLTNLGIPALAYEEAVAANMRTVGIACARASEYEVFPVDLTVIEGEDWGDESERFIHSIDCLLRVGGGEQSRREVRMFFEAYPSRPIFEVELERK